MGSWRPWPSPLLHASFSLSSLRAGQETHSGQDEIPEEISPLLFLRRLGREEREERGDYKIL